MTLGASTFGDELGGWATGCIVLLIGVWLFLALLGIRNSRFPWRIAGGSAFVLGSVLWLGLHPSLAEDWNLDAGKLAWKAQVNIAEPLAGSAFALNALGALLLLCSTIGFLVAIDWLPLLPLAPLLARVDQRLRQRNQGNVDRGNVMLRASAAPVLEREASERTITAPSPGAPDTLPAAAPAVAPEVAPEVATPADSVTATNWARFRPRATTDIQGEIEGETSADLPMDNPLAATHNSSTPGGETRAPSETVADQLEEKDEPVLDQDNVDAELTNGAATTSVAPPMEDVEDVEDIENVGIVEDDPNAEFIEPDEIDEADETEQAVEIVTPGAAESAEAPAEPALAPRRKTDEPEEEPAEEPGKEDDEDDEEEGDDEEKEPDDADEEDDDEDWDDDEEEKEEDEEWDEDEEKKEGDDKEEDDKEEDEEEDEEDEEDDDEDWEEDEEDEEEEKEGDTKDARRKSAPVAEVAPAPAPEPVLDPILDPILEVAPEIVPEVTPEVVVNVDDKPAATGVGDLPPNLFKDLEESERTLLARAVELLLGIESVSLSKLQRELAITYYAAARVFERLEKERFIAPYSGSLSRPVTVTRADWEMRRQART